ncbi:hypothetical protein IFM89_006280 [Coptis chinensis]|uniref:Uncharacterized protein n=1 Tax=Coptis chinensis TaxID=261450 RepID=A0A835GWT7_9MAGN|nr:hypothetical protein IFM89_006280 [Coptis chinensis]
MQKYYMAYSREFVRIVSIQKSPVIHLFGESIVGWLQSRLWYGRACYAYDLNLNARLSWWILSFCKLENKIISIERIHQYSQLPSEAPLIIEDSRPPSSWPDNGTIELTDLKVS